MKNTGSAAAYQNTKTITHQTTASVWYHDDNVMSSFIDWTRIIPGHYAITTDMMIHTLRWRHNGRYSVSNHQPHGCLLNRLFRRRSKKTSKLRVTGLCAGEFPAQMANNVENISIWWRHHDILLVLNHGLQLKIYDTNTDVWQILCWLMYAIFKEYFPIMPLCVIANPFK